MKAAGRRAAGVRDEECLLHAEEILRRHQELLAKMDAIEKRLFKDNGTLSMQTRIERHEQILKVLLWVTSIVVGAVLTSGVMGLILFFKWALAHGAIL